MSSPHRIQTECSSTFTLPHPSLPRHLLKKCLGFTCLTHDSQSFLRVYALPMKKREVRNAIFNTRMPYPLFNSTHLYPELCAAHGCMGLYPDDAEEEESVDRLVVVVVVVDFVVLLFPNLSPPSKCFFLAT